MHSIDRRSAHVFVLSLMIHQPPRRSLLYSSEASDVDKGQADYRVVIVGDATMSPHEIVQPGGSVEHWNDESGAAWMQRLTSHFPRLVWLNPEPEERWEWTPSVGMVRTLVGGRMFPLTIEGLDRAMRALRPPGLS